MSIKNTIIIIVFLLLVGGFGYYSYFSSQLSPDEVESPQITPTEPTQVKLGYNVGGCGEQEEREYREYVRVKGEKQQVNIDIENGFINLTHDLRYVCCADIKVGLESLQPRQDYTLIKINEKNEGDICKCICNYEVDINIGPLEEGKYIVQIWGVEFKKQTSDLLWEKEIVLNERDIGGGGNQIEKTCEDLCGDGICQEVVCQAVGCPCAETPESCPQDCLK